MGLRILEKAKMKSSNFVFLSYLIPWEVLQKQLFLQEKSNKLLIT
jgi:hypothetical protein